mmetsp:Transcript_7925/g.19687  ORF Transcript_7925/g.19687 Transcript_7925/m.19687 type:complete len:253 (-) Transcript_7925:2089-2847(-)
MESEGSIFRGWMDESMDGWIRDWLALAAVWTPAVYSFVRELQLSPQQDLGNVDHFHSLVRCHVRKHQQASPARRHRGERKGTPVGRDFLQQTGLAAGRAIVQVQKEGVGAAVPRMVLVRRGAEGIHAAQIDVGGQHGTDPGVLQKPHVRKDPNHRTWGGQSIIGVFFLFCRRRRRHRRRHRLWPRWVPRSLSIPTGPRRHPAIDAGHPPCRKNRTGPSTDANSSFASGSDRTVGCGTAPARHRSRRVILHRR